MRFPNRRTKIIATLGPATDDPDVIEQLVKAGVDLVRINFSHGTAVLHQERIEQIRKLAAKHGCCIGVLADLQGPKIRISGFATGSINLVPGSTFDIDPNWHEQGGTINCVGTDYKALAQDIKVGDTLLLDDGRLALNVVQIKGSRIKTTVVVGGTLLNNKGLNLKGGGLSVDALTAKDRRDIEYAARFKIDYVAVSFTRSVGDLTTTRKLLKAANSDAGVIAKIERPEAVTNIEQIIKASDGVMVARGDLAVELGDAEVPAIQKQIIQRSRSLNKPVITATQMMESMIESTVPTRAEVSDVANAILDGTDAVMLSAETAVGKHPVTVIEAVRRVCYAVERQPITRTSGHRMHRRFERVDEMISMATMYAANHMDVKAIAAVTSSGTTALWMSRLRTGIPIFGISHHPGSLGRMTLYRNVTPFGCCDLMRLKAHDVNKKVIADLKAGGFVQEQDFVIITKGDHAGTHGSANTLKIVQVGKVG